MEKPPEFLSDINKLIPVVAMLQGKGSFKGIINDYLYWDKIKYKAEECTPEELWSSVKLYRNLRYTAISFGKYTFNFMLTDKMLRLLHEFDLQLGGNLSSNTGIAETDSTKFMVNSVIEEAISSSQIEGAVTTRKKAKEMIRQEKKPANKSERMILNNFLTMKYIVQHKQEELTPEGILYVHELISAHTLDDKSDEGRFRGDNDVHVVNHSSSEIVHTPPPFNEVNDLIADLCLFFNQDQASFIHPIVKGCIIHFMIGWIHPFADGNGRTARALFYWYLLKQGYWLTEYMSISRIIQDTKVQYEKAYQFTEQDDNDLGYFIDYHLKTMSKAYAALKDYISHKQREISQAARFMKIPGINDRMAQILKIFTDDRDRVLNAKEVENRFTVSGLTARTDLKALVHLGYLETVSINKKQNNYIRSDQFDQLTSKIAELNL